MDPLILADRAGLFECLPTLSYGTEREPRRLLPNIQPLAGLKNVKFYYQGFELGKETENHYCTLRKKVMRKFRALVVMSGSLKKSGGLKLKTDLIQRRAWWFSGGRSILNMILRQSL